AQKSRNRKKNTGSSAGFHQKQLNLSVFFIYWLVFAQPHQKVAGCTGVRQSEFKSLLWSV
ncbi:hypothetical protein, partial [Streptococcus suis]|uniref:hypothetical protein n=1 Tax=Streptococcus suis TaxID=1307 RepID=UPI001EDD2FB7